MKELLLGAFLLAQGVPKIGIVTGRLLGVDGMPAVGIRVMARLDARYSASGVAVIASIARTDDSGRYRLENILPGRYVITAGPIDSPTYYPGVAGAEGAKTVIVSSGSDIGGVDFAISRDAGYKISGSVIREGDHTLLGTQHVMLSGTNLQSQTSVVAQDGSFQFFGLRPGTYSIAVVPRGGPETRVSVVNTDVVIRLTAPAIILVKVAGHVTDSSNMPATGATTIRLLGGPGAVITFAAAVNADGSFEFSSILPGKSVATVLSSGNRGLRVIEVTVGEKDINDLNILIPSQ